MLHVKWSLVCLIVGAFAFACAGRVDLPKTLPNALNEACSLYRTTKPDIVKARAWAAANWSIVPDDIKPTLLDLDKILPKLDAAGEGLCLAADSTSTLASSGGKIDWDQVLTVVLKAAGYAIQLKQQKII